MKTSSKCGFLSEYDISDWWWWCRTFDDALFFSSRNHHIEFGLRAAMARLAGQWEWRPALRRPLAFVRCAWIDRRKRRTSVRYEIGVYNCLVRNWNNKGKNGRKTAMTMMHKVIERLREKYQFWEIRSVWPTLNASLDSVCLFICWTKWNVQIFYTSFCLTTSSLPSLCILVGSHSSFVMMLGSAIGCSRCCFG